MKILYIGDLWKGSTALQRYEAMVELGNQVYAFDTTSNDFNYFKQKIYNLSYKIGYPIDFLNVNSKIEKFVISNIVDICWIDKGLNIRPSLIKKLTRTISHIFNYSPDDMINPKNQTKFYLESINLFNTILTTKSFNVNELKNLGAQNVYFVSNCFDHNLHRKITLSKEDYNKLYSKVGFIGSYELDRFNHILYLVKRGIPVRVYGKSWEKFKNVNSNLIVDSNDYYGHDYVKVINAIDINLCFLRKENRDLQTQRSVEIPACHKMMIAEKTPEHSLLFEEDSEAIYFNNGNFEELYEKVKYFSENLNLVRDIGSRAYERCIKDNYSYKSQIKNVFKSHLR